MATEDVLQRRIQRLKSDTHLIERSRGDDDSPSGHVFLRNRSYSESETGSRKSRRSESDFSGARWPRQTVEPLCEEFVTLQLPRMRSEIELQREQSKAFENDSDDEALDEQALESAFDRQDGAWTVHARLPEGGWVFGATEEPHARRTWSAVPKSLDLAAATGAIDSLLEPWGVAAINIKGCKGPFDRTLGQDNFCLTYLGNGWEAFGVFDGHGPCGHWPALRAARVLPALLQGAECSGLLQEGRAEAALRAAFRILQNDLMQAALRDDVDLTLSGCTASVALRHCEKPAVWVATVGDSRVALLNAESGVVLRQTRDHNGSRPDEAKRVRNAGAELRAPYGDRDGPKDFRVYIPGTPFPGLNMTRSLGDCLVKDLGIIADPEIVWWSLDGHEDNAYLLLCSDGVWEFIDTQEASKIVVSGLRSEGGTPQTAVKDLLARAETAWEDVEGPDFCDDITVVLCKARASTSAPRWVPSSLDEGLYGHDSSRDCVVA